MNLIQFFWRTISEQLKASDAKVELTCGWREVHFGKTDDSLSAMKVANIEINLLFSGHLIIDFQKCQLAKLFQGQKNAIW